MADKFNPSSSQRKEKEGEEENKVDLTLRLGVSSEMADKQPEEEERGADVVPVMYDFFGIEGEQSTSLNKGDISHQFQQFHGMTDIAGGSSVGAAGFATLVPLGAATSLAIVPYQQGFVPHRENPHKRLHADVEKEDDNKICSHCGRTNTPLWRRGPDGQTLCNACGLRFSRANKRN